MATKTSKNGANRVKQTLEQQIFAIPKANFASAAFQIYGTAPYVQSAFSAGKMEGILKNQQSSKAKTRKASAPRDVQKEFEEASHRLPDGKYGIPASAFRSACISACRVAGFQMTKAKLSLFVEPDGFDVHDGQPLIELLAGEPEMSQMRVRIQTTTTIAVRPMWREWSAVVNLRWDGDQFTTQDVLNLLDRAGQQVGIGEGRPDSRSSNGMGWGTFTCEPKE
jgi:hypothetical protein